MEGISSTLTLNKATINSRNLCDKFTDSELVTIGSVCSDAYEADYASREKWFRQNTAALDLAMQVQEIKSFPWQGASNIKFPLLTIAAMQFHSRAYPAIINGRDLVKCRIVGGDPDGSQAVRGKRISEHMSWQLLEEDEDWEEEQDRLLLVLPIVGTVFKKTYFSPSRGHNVSETVLPQHLIFDYWAKSVTTCPVITQIIPMHRNRIYENVRRGYFNDVLGKSWFKGSASPAKNRFDDRADNRKGVVEPASNQDTPFTILEQYCVLDLDDDGYAEPYIVTFEEDTKTVLRIVSAISREQDVERNAANEVISIRKPAVFTKVPFIPSPDGGIMDVGFGTLIGPLNESTNTLINQLTDAGTMANTAGGFLGRGAKIRGGQYEFSPFGWNRVDSTGDDLRKNIFPLPVREPSAVLFNLLNLLIDFTQRVAGATDLMTGVTPGQNTPAETSRNAVEQGEKIYSAIFKRIWRAYKGEFKKLYILNGINLSDKQPFGDGGSFVLREDYTVSMVSVIPVADPTISSAGAKLAKATLVKGAAAAGGGYDQAAVERYFLDAAGVENIDVLFPGPDSPLATKPGEDPKIAVEKLRIAAKQAQLELDKWMHVTTLQETMRLNSGKLMELQASAQKLMEEAKSEGATVAINAFNAAANSIRDQNNHLQTQVQNMMEELNNARDREGNGMATGVSPLVIPSSDPAATQVPGSSSQGLTGAMV